MSNALLTATSMQPDASTKADVLPAPITHQPTTQPTKPLRHSKLVGMAFVVLVVLAAGLLPSCVSKKKFNDLLKQKDSLSQHLAETKRDLGNAQADNDKLRAKVKQLESDTTELGRKLRNWMQKYADQKADYQKQIADLKANYEQLKSQNSDEMQRMITRLEQLQRDLAAREQRLAEVERRLNERDSLMQALRSRIQNALQKFEQSGISVTVKNGKVYVMLSDKLLFDLGKTTVHKEGKNALVELANVLVAEPDIQINVEGHTDSLKVKNLGQIKDNLDLSALRSTEVARILSEDGKVDPRRIAAAGKGEYFPVETNTTPEGRAKNRRTEIILTPNLVELYDLIENKQQ